jgi:two-component system OmpR family response regulator
MDGVQSPIDVGSTASSASTSKPRVLVVDDEVHITELLALALSYNGFAVDQASSGASAIESLRDRIADLVILDVMLPDLGGFEVARRLRSSEGPAKDVPIIFLTARDSTQDKVEGLRLGSDDYVTKPFSVEELVERVRAVLRRSGDTSINPRRLAFYDLEVDEDTRDVWRSGRLIELTPTEFKLLQLLMSNARKVVTREQILEEVWQYTFSSSSSVLDTYISYLRSKIDAEGPPLIHTVRGVGYSLRLPRS